MKLKDFQLDTIKKLQETMESDKRDIIKESNWKW